MSVERAFKGRWRCLLKRNDSTLDHIISLVAACFTLHNFCIIHDDHVIEDWTVTDHKDIHSISHLDPGTPHYTRNSLKNIRLALVNYVSAVESEM